MSLQHGRWSFLWEGELDSQDFIMLCRRLKHALTASEARLEDLHKDVEVGAGS